MLSPGERLGSFEILSLLGKGGMGEVYRARDGKLKREVALKVLPPAFGGDLERMARFQREAEVLASLNHTNIAALYGVEERALVMELVEGESPQGPLSADEAWKIAAQIAQALEYAHDRGVVHRDLKPANVKVTPEGVVKLLDFGLAKVWQDQILPESGDPANSPTVTLGGTVAGTILGTAAYMSPEQAKGRKADKRADVWAWGVVLWELLTGERLFQGEDIADTLAQVLTKQPDFTRVPAKFRRLLDECLQKDPKLRLRDVGDAHRLLTETQPQPQAARPLLALAAWVTAAVMTLAAGVALWAPWRAPVTTDAKLIRLNVDLGPDAVTADYNTFAISPDGERLVFTVRGADGKTRLATRLLSDDKPTILEGTENPASPFFSPDGAWIAFGSDGKLRKVQTRGGAPKVICDASSVYGGAWTENGTILFSPTINRSLVQVSVGGGSAEPFSKLTGSDVTHRWPQALPGGEYILASASSSTSDFESGNILAISSKTGEAKQLVEGGYFARFVAGSGTSPGHLLFLREGTLFSVGFDAARLEVQGEPIPVVDEVDGNNINGAGHWDVSRNGVLVYRRGRQTPQRWPVVWMDQTGQTRPLLSEPAMYRALRLSPDGSRLALSVGSGGGSDMFMYDVTRETLSRLTSAGKGKSTISYATWTADGKHVVSAYPGPSGFGLAWYRSDGGGEPQILLDSKVLVFPFSISPDGKRITYTRVDPVTDRDLWILPLDTTEPEHPKAGKPEPFLQTPVNESSPLFSPDGRWIAYHSSEGGRFEMYVRSYPGPGGKWQVSRDGGHFAQWSPDGRALYFLSPDFHIMVADVEAKGDTFSPGKPRQWSPVPVWNPVGSIVYSIHPDGKRFAVLPVPQPSPEEKGNAHVTFLLNFGDELRRRIPAGK